MKVLLVLLALVVPGCGFANVESSKGDIVILKIQIGGPQIDADAKKKLSEDDK